MNKGLFINVDGADGTGKSTSLQILKMLMLEHHQFAIFTSEPEFKGNKESKAIHHILETNNLSKDLQVSLFIIARKLHIKDVIAPQLYQNNMVITSRYVLSNMAYQGDYQLKNGKYYDNNHILKQNMKDIKNFKHYLPDINFYFYLDPKDEKHRLDGRLNKQDRFDKYLEQTNHLVKLQNNYKYAISEMNHAGSRVIPINAGKYDQYQRASIMWEIIKQSINTKNKPRSRAINIADKLGYF